MEQGARTPGEDTPVPVLKDSQEKTAIRFIFLLNAKIQWLLVMEVVRWNTLVDPLVATSGTFLRSANGIASWARQEMPCLPPVYRRTAVVHMLLVGFLGITQPRTRVLLRERFASIGAATAVNGM